MKETNISGNFTNHSLHVMGQSCYLILERANTSKADTTLNSSGCNEEASTSFNSSGYEFDPDTSYSADDLEVFLNLAKMAKSGHLKKKEPWNTG